MQLLKKFPAFYGTRRFITTQEICRKLQSSVSRCLRRIVKVRGPVTITNELWKQTNETKISEQITRRKWNWICLTLRKENAIEKEGMEWNRQGQRKRGRPKRSWQRTIREEALAVGKTWGEIRQLSKNRARWRHFVTALCSSES
jgi:hypothetical protein